MKVPYSSFARSLRAIHVLLLLQLALDCLCNGVERQGYLKRCCRNDPGDGTKIVAKHACVLGDALVWVVIAGRDPEKALLVTVVLL